MWGGIILHNTCLLQQLYSTEVGHALYGELLTLSKHTMTIFSLCSWQLVLSGSYFSTH